MRNKQPEADLADRSQWPIMARVWEATGSPLRPSAQDAANYQAILDEWLSNSGRAPRGLILGVTPELYNLAWPDRSLLRAVDRTDEMIAHVWPGPAADVYRADWRAIPRGDASVDLTFCDGGLHLLDHPDSQRQLRDELARLLAPDGYACFRLFTLPKTKATPDDVLAALSAGEIPDLNCLKLRLGMALQETPATGVAVRTVWETLRGLASDWDSLAERLGWDPEHVRVIDAYRDSPARYYFRSTDDVVKLFTDGGAFEFLSAAAGDYILGAQCPVVAFRRVADA